MTEAKQSRSPNVEPQHEARFDWRLAVLTATAMYAMVGGAVTILGWWLDIPRLTDWVGSGISMFPNAALCGSISGIALLLLSRNHDGYRWHGAVRILGMLVGIIGGLTILQHVSGVSLGIDTLLFSRPWGQRGAAGPMRMGPPASTSYLILGSALLLATYEQAARRFASALAIVPIAIASLSIIGYSFGADQLYTLVHLTAISFQTSTIIAALGIGVITAIPDQGMQSLLCRNDAGGMLVRRLLFPIIAVPLLVAWFRLLGEEAGLYDTEFGLALVSLATIGMLIALLTWTAIGISRSVQAANDSRDELEAVLQRDLSARIQAEQAIREREQRYELVLTGAEAAIWDWDVLNKRVLYSPRWKHLRGLTDAEISDDEEEWSKGIHPDDRDRVLAAVQAHFEGRTPVFCEEYRVQHKDGRWMWILDRGIARRNEAGVVVRMAGSGTDITERKKAEEELRQAEERMRSVVDHVVDGIIAIDEYGSITSFNPAAEKLFGYEGSEVIGRNVKLLMPEPYRGQHDGYLQNYLTTGQAKIIGIGREVVGQRKDGSAFPMELSVSTFQIGPQRFFTGIVRDITERKQLEDQLRQRVKELAEVDRRKNEFLATLAHELRNPLAPIRNSLEVLRMTKVEDIPSSGLQEIMERQVNHMVRLVDDLLEVSRITNGRIDLRPEPVEIESVLRSAVETSKPLIEANGHDFTIKLPADRLTVVADPVRLSQVIANLLNNAAKYTRPGGKIWLAAARHDGEVSISVRDNGIGISSEMRPQLFRMFSQGDRDYKHTQGGLGIGLSLAKTLVEMQGGRIELQSDGDGHGSEFIVTLPLAERELSIADGATSNGSEMNASTRARVLVVDDNQDAASSLAMLLRVPGNDVQSVNNGRAALDAIQSFRPSVVLLDLGMPGMSGYEVAERARALPEGKQCVLIALTGWGQKEDRRRTQEAGFDYHMLKPVDLEQLKTILAKLQRQNRLSEV